IFLAADFCRIALWPDQHEIVVHDLIAPHGVAIGHERFFRRLVVNEYHVGIAAPANVERLSGSEREHPHADAGLRREARKEIPEQTGLFGRGGGGHRDEWRLTRRRQRKCQSEKRGEEYDQARHVQAPSTSTTIFVKVASS